MAFRSQRISAYRLCGSGSSDSEQIGLRRVYLADIFVKRDNPETIQSLLAAAVRQAHVEGAANHLKPRARTVEMCKTATIEIWTYNMDVL